MLGFHSREVGSHGFTLFWKATTEVKRSTQLTMALPPFLSSKGSLSHRNGFTPFLTKPTLMWV